MISPTTYHFRKVTPEDLDLLARWRATLHVRAWWDSDEPYSLEELADERVARWIVSTQGRAFGYMQDYTVHGWDDHHFASLPKGARGIDQFIGDPNMIGLEHGQGMIRAQMQRLFEAGVPVIGTDPHPDNERAIAVYTKLGFVLLGPAHETKWGLILPMIARPQQLP